MRKIFVSGKIGDTVTVTGEQHAHLAFSMRLRVGEEVVVSNQSGIEYLTKAESILKTETVLKVISSSPSCCEPTHRVTLFFSPLKGDKSEVSIQKCTELGITAFQPFMTQNMSVAKQSVRLERLNKITLEAAKQCGRDMVPEVRACMDFSEAVKALSAYDKVIFLYENAKTGSLTQCGLSAAFEGKSAIVVGSEGGFTQSEAQQIAEVKNALTVSLGSRILRAETACITASALVLFLLGELDARAAL